MLIDQNETKENLIYESNHSKKSENDKKWHMRKKISKMSQKSGKMEQKGKINCQTECNSFEV